MQHNSIMLGGKVEGVCVCVEGWTRFVRAGRARPDPIRVLEVGDAGNVMFRRNDQQRKGHYPRLGRSVDPALDVVHQLKTYMRVAGLEQDPRWP